MKKLAMARNELVRQLRGVRFLNTREENKRLNLMRSIHAQILEIDKEISNRGAYFRAEAA